ncbi:MAG: hypothetical protein EPO62_08895 [Candidatus Nitrosotenuis sp.]|nr:MAG: hypothetical protein EPO62_08895 [Candidatus Nitrosotenuis sp.]
MDGFFQGQKRTYDIFKTQIKPSILPTFDSLREYCMGLGNNVVEDVRAHRVVFGKSLSFRWFADMEPGLEEIIIKIQRDRKEPQKTITVKGGDDLAETKRMMQDAYNTIR